jgi:outer membrane protein assembly factor BamB
LESIAPVPGSVVVEGGAVCFASGRAARLDEGLTVCSLDLVSGQERWRVPAEAARGPNDVLVLDGDTLRLQAQTFDFKTGAAGKGSGADKYLTHYNDYSWWGRPKFMSPLSVERLAFDDRRYYGVRWDVPVDSKLKHNPVERAVLVSEGIRKETANWETPLPFLGNSLCVANGVVLVAGAAHVPAVTGRADKPLASQLWLVSGEDGKRLKEIHVPGVPVDDGMIVAGGKVYVTTVDGKVICLGSKKR